MPTNDKRGKKAIIECFLGFKAVFETFKLGDAVKGTSYSGLTAFREGSSLILSIWLKMVPFRVNLAKQG